MLRTLATATDRYSPTPGLRLSFDRSFPGAAKPQLMGYVDKDLAGRRDEHLRSSAPTR